MHFDYEAGGHTYHFSITENSGVPTDPVVYVSVDDNDEPAAAIHLNSGGGPHCDQPNHVTLEVRDERGN